MTIDYVLKRTDRQPKVLFILEVNEQSVKADGNHPLAAEDVSFELTLRDIQKAA